MVLVKAEYTVILAGQPEPFVFIFQKMVYVVSLAKVCDVVQPMCRHLFRVQLIDTQSGCNHPYLS